MSNNLDKINKLVGNDTSDWLNDAKKRRDNRSWNSRSFEIAVLIHREIRRQKPINGMNQKKLAKIMGVSPQYINKVLKGQENLTLETIEKIESVLEISLIEVCGGTQS